MTWAQDGGIDRDVREFSVARVEGSKTVAAYARSDLLKRRRPVMQQYAAALGL